MPVCTSSGQGEMEYESWSVTLDFCLRYVILSGGYTVVLYSEGMARDHQSACLGIYRSSGYLNGRPVYKQDEGENYLYYHKTQNSWLIGPHIGNTYAWVRNQLDHVNGANHSSSSSSSSSSDSDSDSDVSVASASDHSIGSAGKWSWGYQNNYDLILLRSSWPI